MHSMLKRWYQQQVNQLEQSIAALYKRQGMTELHNLRVSVKAIRAVLDHVANTENTFGEAYPTLQGLYKRSGKKRDARMMRHRLQTLPSGEKKLAAIRLLEQRIETAGKKLKTFLHQPQTRETLQAECRQLQLLQPERKQLLAAWKKLRNQPIPTAPDGWHSWRKQLKQRFFLGAALNRPAGTMQHLQTLQHAIGEWHDWENACLFLERHRSPAPMPEDWLIMQQAALVKEDWAKLIRLSGNPV